MSKVTSLNINGKDLTVDVDGERSLLSVLRDDLGLTGSKYGCGEGECGACTILLDGIPKRSCITHVGGVGARKVTTIEGIESNGKLHPIQEAFLNHGAMQCAYCTSGMIMSGFALITKNNNPTDAQIVKAMNGNICRCGTYRRIMSAIRDGAKALREGAK